MDPATGGLILDPDNALGAPDGVYATTASILGNDLVLDMGAGEEGTGDLKLHYGPLALEIATTVDFLDADHTVITSAPLTLAAVGVGGGTATVTYAQAPQPYRYIRLTSVLLNVYQVDAVESTTYRPDSDNDGLPDDWEVQYGLDPLSAVGNDGATGDPDGDGRSNAKEYADGMNPILADPGTPGKPTFRIMRPIIQR